jgi:hypothetical protein
MELIGSGSAFRTSTLLSTNISFPKNTVILNAGALFAPQ